MVHVSWRPCSHGGLLLCLWRTAIHGMHLDGSRGKVQGRIMFSPSVLLRMGSERIAGWMFGSQLRLTHHCISEFFSTSLWLFCSSLTLMSGKADWLSEQQWQSFGLLCNAALHHGSAPLNQQCGRGSYVTLQLHLWTHSCTASAFLPWLCLLLVIAHNPQAPCTRAVCRPQQWMEGQEVSIWKLFFVILTDQKTALLRSLYFSKW